jgi:hypothetical protein
MSIVAFKNKSVIRHGTTRSARPPPGVWLPQGPFGLPTSLSSAMFVGSLAAGYADGFSLNGGTRAIPVGKTMKMSQQGTPYRGVYPVGHGGKQGRYATPQPVMNVGEASTAIGGNQRIFMKPSTLSTRGMLRKRYRWVYSGQYPNNWVQPIYGGYQSDSASQGLYVQTKSAANDCVVDVNRDEKYRDYRVNHGPFGCQTTPARGYKFNVASSNAPYTKNLNAPQTSSQHTLHVQRKCADPTRAQRPYPHSVNTGTGILTGGINVSSVGNSCGTSNNTSTAPAPESSAVN